MIYETYIHFPPPSFQAVALVGAELADQYGEAEEKKKFQELVIDAEWGIQLGKFGVSFYLFTYFRVLLTNQLIAI